MAMQQEYQAKLADPFGARLADLPPSPDRVGNLPVRKFYRCTDGKRSFDYAYYDDEWYHKAWNESSWKPKACDQGERRNTSFSSAVSHCGSNGKVFWNRTLIFSRNGSTHVNEEIDTKKLTYSSTFDLGQGERTITNTCELIEPGNERNVSASKRQ